MNKIHALGLAGSLRTGSVNRALLRAIARASEPRMRLRIFDLSPVPLYNGDVEAEGDPGPVAALKRAVREADLVIFATPEYNAGLPGVMKNAVDWVSRPPKPNAWEGRPAAVTGATPGGLGTVHAQVQLRSALAHVGALVMPLPRFGVSGAARAFADDGSLADPATAERLERFLERAADWSDRMNNGGSGDPVQSRPPASSGAAGRIEA